MNILTQIMLELCTKMDEGQLNAGTESVWVRKFLTEHLTSNTTIVHGDNETSIKLAKYFMRHRKVKHIHTMYY